VFGLPHLAQGGDAGPLWIAFIDTFILSMVLVWLREQTGNLWAGIVLHAIKNGIAFVSLFILSVR
jgi:membrane protease YdiL (CAAX protease family)